MGLLKNDNATNVNNASIMTLSKKSNEIPEATRQQALDMHLKGLGFRAIGRILKVSHTSVYYWIKQAGKAIELPFEEENVEVVEVDAMHTYRRRAWRKVTIAVFVIIWQDSKEKRSAIASPMI